MRPGILALVLALLSGCFAVSLKARYDATGELGSHRDSAPTVEADDVRVFYDSAPAGFSLAENELKVEVGYQHSILGKVRVTFGEGSCAMEPYVSKDRVIGTLQEAAASAGANALIYATSTIPNGLSGPFGPDGACTALEEARRQGPNLGFGWAVVLQPGT